MFHSMPPQTTGSIHCSRNLACTHSSILSEEGAYINEMEEKPNLDEELFRLRESTKCALQQSWDEVESLQQQCAAHLELTSQPEEQLMNLKKRKSYGVHVAWQRKENWQKIRIYQDQKMTS